MSNLLIVESPGKLKTLRKILGAGWLLEASVGHTTELASDGAKRLGFEIGPEGVVTRYVPRGSRGREVLAKLRRAVRKADKVYLATDPDREGEAIAWHLVQQLKLKNYCRVSYTQITEAAVRAAVARPGTLNLSLISAQRARQCLDKLVGYEVSPLLWSSTGGKSAGRVQSATLRLVCDRERERRAFKPEKYWVLQSRYAEGFDATYEPARPAGTPPPEPVRVTTADEARRIEAIARSAPHVVSRQQSREERRTPPPPLVTSTLQQMAGARHRFSPKHTMDVAQKLYEGIQGKGLITYMRTDAVSLSPEFVADARAWLGEHAPETIAARPPTFVARGGAQEAHEAIRPTSVELTPERAAQSSMALDGDQLKLYRLIWERAVASQCKPATLSRTEVVVECADTRWLARGMTVIDPGYLRFWKNIENEKLLPTLRAGQILGLRDVKVDARVTEAPSRYTEPKLVQVMEKRGIGRPSTYASTLATLKDREYVRLEQGLVVPTPLGMASDEALSRAIPKLFDPDFTARMEAELDQIAAGQVGWERYLGDWNSGYFEPAMRQARELIRGVPRVAPRRPFRPEAGRKSRRFVAKQPRPS